MKYQNWKSFLNKSLLILFLVGGIFLAKFINHFNNSFFTDELDINYLLNGMFVVYGVLLICLYLFVNNKYQYLLIYGLIYSVLGFCMMFISPLLEKVFINANINWISIKSFIVGMSDATLNINITYFELLIIFLLILHGIFKLVFSDTYSKIVRIFEVIVGIMYIIQGIIFIYIHFVDISDIISIKYIFYILLVLLLIDTCLFIIRIIKNGKYIQEEIKEQIIESNASLRKEDSEVEEKKKRIKVSDEVEVIDLEKFFKKE